MNVKKKKKWNRRILQIVLSCALICSILQFMPCKIFASGSVSLDVTELNNDGTIKIDGKYNKHSVYSMQTPGVEIQRTFSIYHTRNADGSGFYYGAFVITSDSCKAKTTRVDDNGSTYDIDNYYLGYIQGRDGAKHYVYCLYQYIGGYYKCNANVTCTYGLTSEIWSKYKDYNLIALEFAKRLYNVSGDDLIKNAMCWESGDTDELENEATKGQIDNPILDSDIGCLVISKKKEADTSGLGDEGNSSNKSNLFRVRFGWKYKTTTGFSLKNNKYAQTFIQVRIQNRSVIYKNLTHKDIKYKLDSYGESAMLYESLGIESQPLRITLTDSDFLKKYLPKYYDEINSVKMLSNTLYLGNKYAFQFRVVCTDDLSVIPSDGASSKWHCGRWTEVTSDFDPVTPNDDEQKTGEIDENGDFIQKDDDTVTKIDDSSSKQYDDDDDAEDDFNSSSKKDKSDKFKWDDFENLVNEFKKVPGLIKSIFSFLPDWVLAFITVGFGIWVFVLIKRAIV